eukprot:9389592-Pyramimonas_sp.AAC.2
MLRLSYAEVVGSNRRLSTFARPLQPIHERRPGESMGGGRGYKQWDDTDNDEEDEGDHEEGEEEEMAVRG